MTTFHVQYNVDLLNKNSQHITEGGLNSLTLLCTKNTALPAWLRLVTPLSSSKLLVNNVKKQHLF